MNRDVARERIDGGLCERAGELAFLPLVTLESGARVGVDRDYAWIVAPESGEPKRMSDTTAHYFYEVVEQPRAKLDDALEAGARAAGLDPNAVLVDFPSVAIARAVLARDVPHLQRLTLLWILPSERRDLRDEIDRIASSPLMPAPLKELAARLRVT